MRASLVRSVRQRETAVRRMAVMCVMLGSTSACQSAGAMLNAMAAASAARPAVSDTGAQGGADGAVPRVGGDGSVPAFGSVPVAATGGAGRVPSSAGSAPVPVKGSAPVVTSPASGTRPPTGPASTGQPDRAWRAACGALPGTRPDLHYVWMSASGSTVERLWLRADGSYSTERSSAAGAYAEDGCYAIEGNRFTWYKYASAALVSGPAPAPGQERVTLGSSTARATFDRRTVPVTLVNGGRTAVIIEGDRYEATPNL